MSSSLAVLSRIHSAPGPEKLDRLNRGVSASTFYELARTLGISTESLAGGLGLSTRTLRTRMTGRPATRRLTADETERVFRVFRAYNRAHEVLGTKSAATAWLNSPQRALGERTPLAMLSRDVGAEEVQNLLGAIAEGIYT